MFGVHPLLVAIFMTAGGAITLITIGLVALIRERIAFNYKPRKVRSTYIPK